jgi:heme o synthase
MSAKDTQISATTPVDWRDYLELCKPKVVSLLLITAMVGMCLASPGWVRIDIFLFATLGIGMAAAAAAVVNHVVDEKIDARMQRTAYRPMPNQRISKAQAISFAAILAVTSMAILAVLINPLTAVLTLFGLVGYAFIYTLYLKHATPQNIVIGGLSGALPPLLGWTSVTNSIDGEAILLVLIVFTWTPPHFWALAIARVDDYKNAKVPMLPVTHGIEFTKSCVVAYTCALLLITLVPYGIGMSGLLYLAGAIGLGGWFLFHALKLKYKPQPDSAMRTFRVSISYLLYLFVLLLLDHYLWLS